MLNVFRHLRDRVLRFTGTFASAQLASRMDEEMQFHVDMAAAKKMREGMASRVRNMVNSVTVRLTSSAPQCADQLSVSRASRPWRIVPIASAAGGRAEVRRRIAMDRATTSRGEKGFTT